MKRLFLTSLLLIFTTIVCSAQSVYDIRNAVEFFESYKMQTGEYSTFLTENEIEGSPFLNDEFIEGTIYTYQKVQFNGIPLRFNVYNDELQFRNSGEQVMAMATPEIVEKAVFGKYQLSYIPYQLSKKIKRGFFIILHEGELSLYARPVVDYQKPKEAAPYKDPEPAQFIQRPSVYYLRVGKEAAVKIETKKDLPQLFPEHQEAITTYIKKNKVKPNKEAPLVALVKYYNSL
ncbi:hypothetical protein [uncultured Draconibacterium sp.]|uniref:hypothetical protein n=1 Tax=uncultured Draconibacterium sp. TaxID=1573823 RepID=UPI0025D3C07A|nr:hypothetical protein [uncultured Draconibacterium sp.]